MNARTSGSRVALLLSVAAVAWAAAGLARRAELSSPAVVPGAPSPPPAGAPKDAPHVLLILASGMPEGISKHLPNLERLAARGRRFTRAYAQYPARGASRTSLMLGWRPDRTGVWWDPTDRIAGATPLQEHFRANGYHAARVGSVFGGPGERQFAWDAALDSPPEQAPRWASDLLARAGDRPLFVAVDLSGAGPSASPPPSGGVAAVSTLPAIAMGSLDPLARPGGTMRPRVLGADERAGRAAAVADRAQSIDARLGPILDSLDRLDLWRRTIVVFAADTGVDTGAHGALGRDDLLFDDALRVPLIVAAPEVGSPGLATEATVELVDVHPTLAAMAGIPPVSGVDGISLVPVLRDAGASVKEAAASVVAREAGQIGRSARTDRFRYTEWPDGSEELFDHDVDPHEFTNLAARAEHATTVVEMRRLLGTRYRGGRGSAAVAPAVAGRRLNVLLVMLDDLNAHVGPHGYRVQTPHIDRLARRGRLFLRAYAQVPTCSPSRSSLLSGWRPERTDIWNNLTPVRQHLEGARPLQEYFHDHGYVTARVGKVYEESMAYQFAWDADDERAAPAEDARRDEDQVRGSWWVPTDNPDEREPDGARARKAAQLMEQYRGRPFFMAVGFSKPHRKWVAPRKYFDLYPPEALSIPEEPEDDLQDVPAIAIKNRAQERPRVPLAGREPPGMWPDPKFRREATAGYYAAVSFADAQVGVLLDALDRLALWDRTVVVLLGDHGFHLGDHHGLWRKDTLFEPSLRTPLVIAAPQVRQPGTPAGAPVELLDVYPTIVDLAGLPPVAGLDGASLRSMLLDPARRVRPAALSFRKAKAPPIGASVRTERYRYTLWPDGSEELYDHASDPAEAKNLAGDPSASEALERMRALGKTAVRPWP